MPSSDLISAALNLYDFLSAQGVDAQSHPEVQAFQQAYVGQGYELHGVGGVYDTPTEIALQSVLDTDPNGDGVILQAPAPAATAPTPDLASSAQAMRSALNAHGYKKADKPLYGTFQAAARAAGLYSGNVDTFPGTNTMAALKTELDSLGLPMPNVPIYPWKYCAAGESTTAGCYDGVNAPPLAEWLGTGAPPAPPPQPQPAQQASMLGPLVALAVLGAAIAGGAAVYEKKTGKKLFQMHPMHGHV